MKTAKILLVLTVLSLAACDDKVDICREGIEEFKQANYHILQHLTCSESQYVFLNNYPFQSSFYRYVIKQEGAFHYQTAFLRLDYEEDIYRLAVEEIYSKSGFSNGILCEYKNYEFHLNLFYKDNNYNIDPSRGDMYIGEISLVGLNTNNCNSIVFLAFDFFYTNDSFDFIVYSSPVSFYPFKSWDIFFEDNFSTVGWDSSIVN